MDSVTGGAISTAELNRYNLGEISCARRCYVMDFVLQLWGGIWV